MAIRTRLLSAACCLAWIVSARLAGAVGPSSSSPGDTGSLGSDLRGPIESAAKQALAESGAPSASIAVVADGKVVFVGAYGDAQLAPRVPARPEMRYNIGSISKQITAAAILLLSEQGALSLNDKVARFLPALTRASEVTIRQVLSHTSGYQDFWPQDYVMPAMLKPIAPDGILKSWAGKPLDFDPGQRWQYSNTNFVIAGLIVEKASGMPFFPFLQQRVFSRLGLAHVGDVDSGPLPGVEPTGYIRHGLGPLRPAPQIGAGWLFAAGQLAMTAEELAKWDISLFERRLLKPNSYADFTTEVLLNNGVGTHYALGIGVFMDGERRVLRHDGEVSGFSAINMVFPEDRAAIVVLINQDATEAATAIATQVKSVLFTKVDPAAARALVRDRKIFEGLQRGRLDRSLFTDNANSYFSTQAIKDFAEGLAPLGAPLEFKETTHRNRGGMLHRVYAVKCKKKSLRVWSREMPDGKLEEFLVAKE